MSHSRGKIGLKARKCDMSHFVSHPPGQAKQWAVHKISVTPEPRMRGSAHPDRAEGRVSRLDKVCFQQPSVTFRPQHPIIPRPAETTIRPLGDRSEPRRAPNCVRINSRATVGIGKQPFWADQNQSGLRFRDAQPQHLPAPNRSSTNPSTVARAPSRSPRPCGPEPPDKQSGEGP
jgi:hypothetical protein